MRLPSEGAWPLSPLQAASHLPLLALPSAASYATLPLLYEQYRVALPADKLGPLLGLLLAKRLTLYGCAIATVFVAAMRSSDAAPGLGERLESITAEAVLPATMPESQTAEVSAVARQLDSSSQATQAAALPLVFSLSLASAYAFQVLLSSTPPPEPTPTAVDDVAAVVRAAFTTVQPLSTASVCLFAVNAEAQATARAFSGGDTNGADDAGESAPSPASIAAAAAALALVASAYVVAPSSAWPAQNVVNACVAIGVARVLQLPNLAALLAGLVGLTLYDGFGTLFAVSAASAPLDPTFASSSMMESVAQAKLGGSQTWQPGLLTVRLEGRLTDALGLGDIVAPSMLAGWCRRFDLRLAAEEEAAAALGKEPGAAGRSGDGAGGGGYLRAALGGYALGCVLLEVVPAELSRAALLFLVPSSMAAVAFRLVERQEVAKAFAPPPADEEGAE